MRKTKPSSIVVQALLLTLLGGQARSLAQPHGPDEPRNDESTQRDDEGQPLPTDEGDVRNASPNRAWGHPRHLDPDRLGRRSYPRTYDGQRRYYYDDYTSRFGVPYRDDPYSDDLERAYRQGVEDGRHSERFDIQAERGFTSYQRAMAEGNTAFLSGRYGDAARAFLLAAQLNQGDPVSRLSAALAHVALGQYEPASMLIHRAFDLQPRIAYLPLDIRTAYGNRADFKKHLEELRRAFELEPNDPHHCLTLGYCYLFSRQPEKARMVLSRAAELDPQDRLIRQLLEAATLTNPPAEQRQKAEPKRTKHDT